MNAIVVVPMRNIAPPSGDVSVFDRPARRMSKGDLFAGSATGYSGRLKFGEPETASASTERALPQANVQISKGTVQTVPWFIPQQITFEETIFNSLVQLKVATATYAMHLPAHERHRIFDRLDELINVDDWHEEDPLPQIQSFKNFLKWIVYASEFAWTSIGVSGEGAILTAWSRPRVTVTANFAPSDRVTWTARIAPEEEGDEPSHLVGSGTPQNFAKFAQFVLSGEPQNADKEHS